MLPLNVNIKRGDTVTWHSVGINEPHTVTFPTDLHTDSVPLCENGSADTPAVPKVNPPTGPQDFACGSGPADEIEFAPGNGVSTVTSPKTVSDSGLLAASLLGGGPPRPAVLGRRCNLMSGEKYLENVAAPVERIRTTQPGRSGRRQASWRIRSPQAAS
jgi:hypothetical protein